jgi:hypothetical protein
LRRWTATKEQKRPFNVNVASTAATLLLSRYFVRELRSAVSVERSDHWKAGFRTMKTKHARFDILVTRYCPALYNFASRLTRDVRGAVLSTARFNSAREQLQSRSGEVALARSVVPAVLKQTGFTLLKYNVKRI